MSVVDTAKTAYDLAKKGMTVEFQEKIMQLRQEALDLQEENLRLGNENHELKKRIELQETVTYRLKLYWRDGDDVPFCPYCYEKSKLLMHMDGSGTLANAEEFYSCEECNRTYRAGPSDEGFRVHCPELDDHTD